MDSAAVLNEALLLKVTAGAFAKGMLTHLALLLSETVLWLKSTHKHIQEKACAHHMQASAPTRRRLHTPQPR